MGCLSTYFSYVFSGAWRQLSISTRACPLSTVLDLLSLRDVGLESLGRGYELDSEQTMMTTFRFRDRL
jgi:hypothetical protein